MEYKVKTKEKCFYQNVLYTAGEEFIFQAETENDLPDYVQVVSEQDEIAENNSAPADNTGTEENTEADTETKYETTGETKNKESPAKKAKKKKEFLLLAGRDNSLPF